MSPERRVPLPGWVPPMMAQVAKSLPLNEDAWAFEMKWDGVRASSYLEHGQLLRLRSRTDRDIAVAYPELLALGPATAGRQLVLDGEIVAFSDGAPSFEALQPRIHVTDPAQAAHMVSRIPVSYLLFDLLHLDGRPTLALPYRQRRELLDSLGLAGPCWQTPPSFTDAAGQDVMDAAGAQRLEGVVAKRLDSLYRPGARSDDWRKVKHTVGQEAVVGGINPGQGNRAGTIGSLLLGVYTDDGLAYAGRVGTGFSAAKLRQVEAALAPWHTRKSPFATEVPAEYTRGVTWVQPRLVIEVQFAGWTQDGRMRAASYRGIRTDKDPAEVIRET